VAMTQRSSANLTSSSMAFTGSQICSQVITWWIWTNCSQCATLLMSYKPDEFGQILVLTVHISWYQWLHKANMLDGSFAMFILFTSSIKSRTNDAQVFCHAVLVWTRCRNRIWIHCGFAPKYLYCLQLLDKSALQYTTAASLSDALLTQPAFLANINVQKHHNLFGIWG
jgi:hypothetical protein